MSDSRPPTLAIVGGTGFDRFDALENSETLSSETPYGRAAPIISGHLAGQHLLFMPRHGSGHRVPPHLINYRANVWALREQGAVRVLGVNAVGGIRADMAPGRLVIPSQIVDYTHGREHTYFVGDDAGVEHVDFTEPYDAEWRNAIIRIASEQGFSLIDNGVYACTQGPRLETAAEVRRLQNDGCDLVGMTGMPEAALAKELGLRYAALAVVVNRAAGLTEKPITVETVYQQLQISMDDAQRLIAALLPGTER